jgi:hypothetical protein
MQHHYRLVAVDTAVNSEEERVQEGKERKGKGKTKNMNPAVWNGKCIDRDNMYTAPTYKSGMLSRAQKKIHQPPSAHLSKQ